MNLAEQINKAFEEFNTRMQVDIIISTIKEFNLKFNSNHEPAGTSVGGQFASADDTLQGAEDKIRDDKEESAYIFKDGKKVLFKDGKKFEVEFDDDELKLMDGAVLTHNHPGGRSFSKEDIGFFASNKMREIRAVSVIDDYSLINDSGVPINTIDIERDYSEIEAKVKSNLLDKVNKKLITLNYANENYHHQIMKRLAAKYKITYTRKKRL